MTTGPGPPYPPPAPPPPPRKISVAMVFVGAPIFIVINTVLGFAAFIVAGGQTDNSDAILGGAAVLLGLIAFGVGGYLLTVKSPQAKGIGLGLMIGWALTSLVTVGICTGINPSLYSM